MQTSATEVNQVGIHIRESHNWYTRGPGTEYLVYPRVPSMLIPFCAVVYTPDLYQTHSLTGILAHSYTGALHFFS